MELSNENAADVQEPQPTEAAETSPEETKTVEPEANEGDGPELLDNPAAEEMEAEENTFTDEVEEEVDPADALADELAEESEPKDEADENGLYEIEVDGETAKVPKKMRDAFMKNADYTQKTQAVAKQKEQIAQERRDFQKEITQLREMGEKEIHLKAEVTNVERALQQYQNVNWDRLDTEDPLEAQRHWRNFQQLKDRKEAGVNQLKEIATQNEQRIKQQLAKRRSETQSWIKENLPNWTNEKDQQLHKFAVDILGFPSQNIKDAITPEIYQALYLAQIGQRALDKAKTARPKAKTAQQTQPLKTVSSKSASSRSTKNPADMGMDEYVRHRNRQLKNKD